MVDICPPGFMPDPPPELTTPVTAAPAIDTAAAQRAWDYVLEAESMLRRAQTETDIRLAADTVMFGIAFAHLAQLGPRPS